MSKEDNNTYIHNGLEPFINRAVSPFHTIHAVKDILQKNGFTELQYDEAFDIKQGGKYYIDIYASSLMAFTVGKDFLKDGHRIAARVRCTSSHTDFPGFKIKPNSLIAAENKSGSGYVKINTEVYGGPILNTWLDRPLSAAGRLVVREKAFGMSEKDHHDSSPFKVRSILVDAKKPVMIIPNLAIHMNREVNKGVELNRQKDMLPIIALTEGFSSEQLCRENNQNTEETNKVNLHNTDIVELLFSDRLKELGISQDDILDYELYIYNTDKGEAVGINSEMYAAPRLDNLTSVFAQTNALVTGNRDDGLNIALYFDNEEIGSRTKQGAASNIISLLLEKIYISLGYDRNHMIDDILSGMMISVDVAHAAHPNSPEKSDPTNAVMLNKGIVIKIAASQSYANDAIGTSVIKGLCSEHHIDCQVFVNKSDMPGGQTLGAVSSTVLPFRTIDIGIPLLAMHSSRELMGMKDEKNLEKFLTVYYS